MQWSSWLLLSPTMSSCIFQTQQSWGHWQRQEPGPEMYMNQYSCSKWNRSLVMLCQYSSSLTQGTFWYTPTDGGTKRGRAIKGGMSRQRWICFSFSQPHPNLSAIVQPSKYASMAKGCIIVPHTRTPPFFPPQQGCWRGTRGIRRTRAPWCGWNGNWDTSNRKLFNASTLQNFYIYLW